jgi:hypothetical protein
MPDTRAAILCPHCEEPTLANLLADGSVVCSCAAERPLPGPHPAAPAAPAARAGDARRPRPWPARLRGYDPAIPASE